VAPRFRHSVIARLSEEPLRHLVQVAQAERLLSEIDPLKQYTYEFVFERLTNTCPVFVDREQLISGHDLDHDVRALIEAVPQAPVEPMMTLDEISKQLNVSTKTIRRWRDCGLIGHRIVLNGRHQLGFPQSVVERFLRENSDRVQRGSKFSQLTEEEKEDILRRARRMSRIGSATLTEVSRRIARRLGRSPETVRYTIKNYDRLHPNQPLFPEMAGPVQDDIKQVIYNTYRRGISIDALAQRFHRPQSAMIRIVNEMRAKQVLAQPLETIYHESFDDPNLTAEILAPMPRADEYESQRRTMKVPKDAPAELASLYEVPLLGRDQEAHLFRQMNYLKYQASQLRDKASGRHVRPEELEEIEDLLKRANAIKDRLINCNLRLVVSIAKKRVGPGDNFFELLSDGNMSLIRAVEKFDYSRGNKFSTYASWAIMKNFARSIPDEKHQRERYQTGNDQFFDAAPDRRTNEQEVVTTQDQTVRQVNRLLDQLPPREREIIRMRSGLDHYSEGMTLEEIGLQLGITKERVRQLNVRAMKSLQNLARGQMDL
jgi:RNA polymerase sigma factor (sigma-70 family)